MTDVSAQQERKAADESDRDPDRRTNPLLVKSVFEEKSNPDDQDQHTNAKEPFLTDRQFGRTPSIRVLLPLGFDRGPRKRWRRFSALCRAALFLTWQTGGHFRIWFGLGSGED